jgi:hypothetical protein
MAAQAAQILNPYFFKARDEALRGTRRKRGTFWETHLYYI